MNRAPPPTKTRLPIWTGPPKSNRVSQDNVVAELTIVPDMAPGHQPAAIADARGLARLVFN